MKYQVNQIKLMRALVIARSRQKTSTFSTAGRAITQIGGVPVGIGKGAIHGGSAVVHGVGHGVGSVGGFAGRHIGLIKKKDKSGKEILVEAPEADGTANGGGYGVPAGQNSEPVGTERYGNGVPGPTATTLPIGAGQGPDEPGVLSITVVSAKDLKGTHGNGGAKPYVQLKMGSKTHKTGHQKAVDPEW